MADTQLRKISDLIFRVLFLSSILLPQSFQREVNPFPVIIEDDELKVPFLGGFNKPAPQFLDWNGDGLVDMFVRDVDGRIQYFSNVGSLQHPEFELQTKSFQDLYVGHWFHFFDYDHDGDIDLMAGPQSPDVSLFENIGDSLIQVVAHLIDDNSVAVYGGQIVIPTVADIDGDGWEDFFVGGISGSVTYYRNTGLTDGVPVYHLETNSFEDILIVWVPGRYSRHGANALEFYDIDQDVDLDLFWGDYYQPGLFFLENFGTPNDPEIPDSLMVDTYPPSDPVNSAGFNVPRLVDLNNDGEAELFVGVQSGAYGTDYKDNFWYYEPLGSGDFDLVTKNYFATIDFISSTNPTLADIDADGDFDLFVGNEFDDSNPGWNGDIYFFENTGTPFDPRFVLVDSTFFEEGLGNNMAPAFGDLDADGDLDALVGDYNGEISFYLNEGQPDLPNFSYQGKFLEIDLAGRASPTLGDIDGNGTLELFVGDKNGTVHVWHNEGDPINYNFVKISDDLFEGENLGLEISLELSDFDFDGELDLLIGNKEGEIYLADPSGGEFHKFEKFPHSGLNLSMTSGDVNGDGLMDLIVGSNEGGLQFFSVGEESSIDSEPLPSNPSLVVCYPNPFNSNTIFRFSADIPVNSKLVIYDLLGRRVEQMNIPDFRNNSIQVVWETSELASGQYIWQLIKITGASKLTLDSGKLMLLK